MIVRTPSGWAYLRDGRAFALRHGLGEMLAGAPVEETGEEVAAELLAPVEDDHEVWASGVTYERSRAARTEESGTPDVYDLVYVADRPELFLKALGRRVVGPGGAGRIRADSGWDVPEPELVLVVDARGEVFGYTIGDDLSSRSIEGANPLYLPQAKVYEGSCVLGPGIALARDVAPPFDIALTVFRAGIAVFEGRTTTAAMRRSFTELTSWLTRGLTFPRGVLLMTGTGVVPDDLTLRHGDTVEIAVPGIGTLTHGVATWTC